MAEDCISALKDTIKNLKRLNIIVAGKTGVGKSTLINAVFRENLVETGIGRPITTHMRKIEKKGFPLCIYDTRGFELGKDAQHEVMAEVMQTIKAGAQATDINDHIHCIWYCINTASNRIEDEELNWLKAFTDENKVTQVPIIVVLTQAFSKKNADAMRKYLQDQNLNIAQIVPVLAQDYEISEEYVAKASGLDTLLQVMSEVLPEELQITLQNVQKASLSEKVKKAHAVVGAAAIAAVGTGAAPIPFSDAALLVPAQVSMLASITAVFGIDLKKDAFLPIISAIAGTSGSTIAGKTLVSNLLKFIPGVGTVTGSAISGVTAGALTTALGEAYIKLMVAIYKGELDLSDISGAEATKIIQGFLAGK